MFKFTDTSRPIASAFGVTFLVLFGGCNASPTDPSPAALAGVWGGDRVSLSIMAMSSRLEFDCAHGTMQGPLTADARGRFVAGGTFVREHGGPIRQDEAPDVHPAIYAGAVTGTTMQLTVRLTATNEVIGTFTLARGAPGRVVKCL